MSSQLGWKVDINSCVGCKACEMACKVEYDIKAGQGRRRQVVERTVTDGGKVRTLFVSMACNQCEQPACIKACPKSQPVGEGTASDSALWKDTSGSQSGGVVGVVRVNDTLCVGCRRCEWACPYGAPQYNPKTGKIHKCEMCWQRIANTTLHSSRRRGACVATCLGQAIKQDTVNTDPTNTTLSTIDDLGNPVTYPEVPFAAPGATVGYNDRGTQYLADAGLTKPALKVRNRVYVKRDGSGLD